MTDNRVYFLGAGASADAGVPLTKDLLSTIAVSVQNSDKRKKLGRFLQNHVVVESEGASSPPIVEAINLLDSCIRENRPLNRFFTVRRLREVRTDLTIELTRAVEAGRGAQPTVPARVPGDAKAQPGADGRRLASYYRRFARTLRPRARDTNPPEASGDSIITTNYDTNVDVALYENVYWQESGGRAGYSTVSDVFLGSDFRDPYLDIDAFVDREAALDLFKLHGSLNWLYCPRCSRIYIAAFGFSVRYIEEGPRSERECHCGYHPLEPLIIAPSAFQEIVNPHLQSIWMHAYQALESARAWVFVGYSLPPEDLAVRSLLYRALDGRKHYHGEEPSVTVICPRKFMHELRPRYEALFGFSVQFRAKRFCDYVRGQPVQ